jgi:hypothetical protein
VGRSLTVDKTDVTESSVELLKIEEDKEEVRLDAGNHVLNTRKMLQVLVDGKGDTAVGEIPVQAQENDQIGEFCTGLRPMPRCIDWVDGRRDGESVETVNVAIFLKIPDQSGVSNNGEIVLVFLDVTVFTYFCLPNVD